MELSSLHMYMKSMALPDLVIILQDCNTYIQQVKGVLHTMVNLSYTALSNILHKYIILSFSIATADMQLSAIKRSTM